MRTIWIFPSVITVRGGTVRGRALRRDPDRGALKFVRNTRSIVFTPELPMADVRLEVCGRVERAQSDKEGFFSIRLDGATAALPLGRHPAAAYFADEQEPVGTGMVQVVPERGLSVVSDFDDTIAVSHIGRTFRMLWTALFRDETQHDAVAGMAKLYAQLAPFAAAFHYVSGTPVGLLRRTERFLARHGFPQGALLLRHFESDGFNMAKYKPRVLSEIAQALPGHRFLFVGDSGEKDPEFFAHLRAELGEHRVAGVLVRRVTKEMRDAARFSGMFVFDDPEEAAKELTRLGVVGPSPPDAVTAS
jgi:phosphatidate phosphatase APP1